MKQPSGETFEGSLHGDEWFHCKVSTKDGDILLQDQKGYWNYAELTSDELKSTGTNIKSIRSLQWRVNEDNLNKWIKKYNPQAKKNRST
ncbi:hypothetical protein AAHB65_02565 [Bacillus toyonensis]